MATVNQILTRATRIVEADDTPILAKLLLDIRQDAQHPCRAGAVLVADQFVKLAS